MKNLIYYTVGTENYLEVIKLSIDSLQKQQYTGDILILTPFKEKLQSILEYSGQIYYKDVSYANEDKSFPLAVATNKLRINVFEDYQNYDKFVYVDSDVIWTNSPNNIFNLIENDEFYMSHDPHSFMSNQWWSKDMLTESEKEEIQETYIRGLNCGLFAFNKTMVPHLQEIYNFFLQKKQEQGQEKHQADAVNEQPYMNVYLYREGKKLGKRMYNTKLAFHVIHSGSQLTNEPLIRSFKKYYKGTALHFAGSPGNATKRIEQMKQFC